MRAVSIKKEIRNPITKTVKFAEVGKVGKNMSKADWPLKSMIKSPAPDKN